MSEKTTPEDRAAMRNAVLKFKRFWNSDAGTNEEVDTVDAFLDAVIDLKERSDT